MLCCIVLHCVAVVLNVCCVAVVLKLCCVEVVLIVLRLCCVALLFSIDTHRRVVESVSGTFVVLVYIHMSSIHVYTTSVTCGEAKVCLSRLCVASIVCVHICRSAKTSLHTQYMPDPDLKCMWA